MGYTKGMNIFELNKDYTVYNEYGAEVGTLRVYACQTEDGVDEANRSVQALLDWGYNPSLPRVGLSAELLVTITDEYDGEQYLNVIFHKYATLGYTLLDSEGDPLNVQEFDDFCDEVNG